MTIFIDHHVFIVSLLREMNYSVLTAPEAF